MGIITKTLVLGCVLTLSQYQMHMIADIWCNDDLITLQLSDRMGNASDTTCIEAADLFHSITTQGYSLYVKPYRTGGWIPTRVNPMDVEWTKKLVESKHHPMKIPKSNQLKVRKENNVTIKIIPDKRKVRPKEHTKISDKKSITITIN